MLSFENYMVFHLDISSKHRCSEHRCPFVRVKSYSSLIPGLRGLVKGQRCSVIVLRARFSIACSENRTGKSISSYSF